MVMAEVPSAPTVPSWETVLHSVEQDVLRTEALLLLAVADLNNPAEAEVASAAKALMEPSLAVLPPLHEMPAVPPTLLERVQALRTRITQVRAELEQAMSANRRMAAGAKIARPVAAQPQARFIDTVA
jgi:hypothetical protein